MRGGRAILVAVALTGAAQGAGAAQLAVPFVSRVTIQTSCGIAVSDLDFGTVGVIAAQTASATVAVSCSSGTPYALSFSSLSSVTAYSGVMTNGAATVAYSATLTGVGGVGAATHAVLGLLLPQPAPPSGIYTDNRTVYLTY